MKGFFIGLANLLLGFISGLIGMALIDVISETNHPGWLTYIVHEGTYKVVKKENLEDF